MLVGGSEDEQQDCRSLGVLSEQLITQDKVGILLWNG